MLAEHPILAIFLAAVAAPLIAQTRLGSRLPAAWREGTRSTASLPA